MGLPEENEFSWAQEVSTHIGTQHHAITVRPEQFVSLAKDLISSRGEPLSVPNEVLLYQMSRVAKRENTVVLCGEGADELFAGYERIFRWADGATEWDVSGFAKLYCYGTRADLEVVEDAVAPFVSRGSALAVTSAFFQLSHLHGLLRRLDNSTMRASIEGRVPFVDHRLVERLAGVPLSYKMSGGDVKAPLKRIFGHLLPERVVRRPKIGFPVNLDEILPAETSGANAMDRWFNFNLTELGYEAETLNPVHT